jgi:hypothetical protein
MFLVLFTPLFMRKEIGGCEAHPLLKCRYLLTFFDFLVISTHEIRP